MLEVGQIRLLLPASSCVRNKCKEWWHRWFASLPSLDHGANYLAGLPGHGLRKFNESKETKLTRMLSVWPLVPIPVCLVWTRNWRTWIHIRQKQSNNDWHWDIDDDETTVPKRQQPHSTAFSRRILHIVLLLVSVMIHHKWGGCSSITARYVFICKPCFLCCSRDVPSSFSRSQVSSTRREGLEQRNNEYQPDRTPIT
jgi:hypothetical protein